MMESTDTVLGIFEVVVFDEAKAEKVLITDKTDHVEDIPFA